MGNRNRSYAGSETADVLTATGDDFVYTPGDPVEVIAVEDVITVTVAGAPVVKWDKRPTAASDTGRGDGDVASLTYPATVPTAGQVVYKELTTPIRLNPGEQAVREVTTTGSAGSAIGRLIYRVLNERPANITAMKAGT